MGLWEHGTLGAQDLMDKTKNIVTVLIVTVATFPNVTSMLSVCLRGALAGI
jgi:hypothetical protein